MPFAEGHITLFNGGPIVHPNDPHACWFPSDNPGAPNERRWNGVYPHTVVATILENAAGNIALVRRHPNERLEGGKLVLPGGHLELRQTLAQAALAEAEQETGFSVVPESLQMFAIMDGPTDLPGRRNEADGNTVHVYTAQAGERIGDHDEEVTGVHWVDPHDLPPSAEWGFGHLAIVGMWLSNLRWPHDLPIIPSGMSREQLFIPGWADRHNIFADPRT